jgi:type II secretory pathway component GspD/PulD (secretin)
VVPTSLQVYNLRNAKADELATVLKKLYPNVDLTGDPRTNALIVRADTETQREIISLLQQLDGPADKPKK